MTSDTNDFDTPARSATLRIVGFGGGDRRLGGTGVAGPERGARRGPPYVVMALLRGVAGAQAFPDTAVPRGGTRGKGAMMPPVRRYRREHRVSDGPRQRLRFADA